MPTPEAELNRACGLIVGTPSSPPEGLLLGLIESAACRINRPDGWIDILVVAQGGRQPDTVEPARPETLTAREAAPFVNYTALLHTRPARLDADLAAFRRILFVARTDK